MQSSMNQEVEYICSSETVTFRLQKAKRGCLSLPNMTFRDEEMMFDRGTSRARSSSEDRLSVQSSRSTVSEEEMTSPASRVEEQVEVVDSYVIASNSTECNVVSEQNQPNRDLTSVGSDCVEAIVESYQKDLFLSAFGADMRVPDCTTWFGFSYKSLYVPSCVADLQVYHILRILVKPQPYYFYFSLMEVRLEEFLSRRLFETVSISQFDSNVIVGQSNCVKTLCGGPSTWIEDLSDDRSCEPVDEVTKNLDDNQEPLDYPAEMSPREEVIQTPNKIVSSDLIQGRVVLNAEAIEEEAGLVFPDFEKRPKRSSWWRRFVCFSC
jgi:hypothetical protein